MLYKEKHKLYEKYPRRFLRLILGSGGGTGVGTEEGIGGGGFSCSRASLRASPIMGIITLSNFTSVFIVHPGPSGSVKSV